MALQETDSQIKGFDEILSKIGFGRWSIFMFSVSLSWAALIPYFSLGGAFYNPKIDFYCNVPEELSNSSWTQEQKENFSIAREENGGILSKCYRYDRNYSLYAYTEWSAELETMPSTKTVPCTSWTYDRSVFLDTVTMEFDLVCGNAWLSPLFQSLYFFGCAIGEPIVGYLADKYGRRWVLRGASVIFLITSVTSSLMPYFSFILVGRFILGILHTVGVGVAYVYVMETCPPKHRTLVGLFLNGPFAITGITFAGLAYLLRNWRTLHLICSIPVVFSLSLVPFMDESPRWQLLKGNSKSSIKTLRKAARWEGVTLTEEDIASIDSKVPTEQIHVKIEKSDYRIFPVGTHCPPYTLRERIFKSIKEIFTLVRTPVIRRITLCMFGCWFVVGLIFWGMSLSGTTFSSDPFLYMALTSLSELPGYLAFVPLVSIFGRKKILSLNFAICASAILAILITPEDHKWTIFALALIGKLFITSSYNILYLFSSELFPTCVRSRGLNTSSMMSRIGSIISPFIIEALSNNKQATWTPSVTFGCCALFGCCMALFLPESKDKPLSETVEEVERLHGKGSTSTLTQEDKV